MTEGPGQQPPQDPRTPASDGPREVLEGRVIPSRASAARAEGSYGAHPPVTGPDGGYGTRGGGADYGVHPGAPGPGAASAQAWSQPPAVSGGGSDSQAANPQLPTGAGDGAGTWGAGPEGSAAMGTGPDAAMGAGPGAQAPAAMGTNPDPRTSAAMGANPGAQAPVPEAHAAIPQQPAAGGQPQGAWGAPPSAATPAMGGGMPGPQPQGGMPGSAPGFGGPGGGFTPPRVTPQAPQGPVGGQPGPGVQGAPQGTPPGAPPGAPQPGAPGSGPGFGPGGTFGTGAPQAAAGTPGGPGGPGAPGGEPPRDDPGFGPNGAFGAPPGGSRSPLGSGGPSFPRQQRPSAPRSGAGRPAGDGGPGAPRKPAETAVPSPGPTQTPDWSALADQAASGARRKRVMMLVGGIVAVAVIAGGVATAVVMSGKSSDHPIADPSASGSTASEAPLPPQPSFSSVAPPPPANPLDYISTAAKDTAPVTAASLFPGKQFVWGGRTYVKTNSAVTTHCSAAAGSSLSGALAANGCHKMVRATYTQGSLAVTIGIAVFSDQKHAAKLHGVAQYVAPLNGGGIADFCHAVACQMTSNYVGRYAYFAISGYKNGKTLPASDTIAKQAANDASDFAFQRIIQRGKDAAQAEANRQ